MVKTREGEKGKEEEEDARKRYEIDASIGVERTSVM